MFGRSRFAKLVDAQLDVFVRDRGDVLDEVRDRLEAYNRADRSEAEELYGDYVDVVETGTELLADIRDAYAATLPEGTDELYVAEFNRGVARRWKAFAVEIENR